MILSFRRLSVEDPAKTHELYYYVNRFSPQFEKDNMCYMSTKQRHIIANIPFPEHTVHHSSLDLSRSYVMDDDVDNIGPRSMYAPSKYSFQRTFESSNDESSDEGLSHDSSDSELDDDCEYACGKTCNVNPSNGKPYKEPIKKTDKLIGQHFSMFKSTQRKSGRESASLNKSNSQSAERTLDAKQRKADEKKRKSIEAAAKALQKAKSKVAQSTGEILPAVLEMFRSLRLDMAGIATQRRK